MPTLSPNRNENPLRSLSVSVCIIISFVLVSCHHDSGLVSNPSTPCSLSFTYGYCDKTSYFPGDVITAFIQSKARVPSCVLDIYNMKGDVVFSVASQAIVQKISDKDPSVYGYGFLPTVLIAIPDNLASGIYLIEKQVPFIVKSKTPVDLLVVYPSNTANAYNLSGGKSLYTVTNKPSFVSFLRPIPVQANAEVFLKWISFDKPFTVGFVCDFDLDDYSMINQAKIIAIAGHSEYWTRKARRNFDRFVNEGGHALVLSGNTMWWQVRYSSDNSRLIRYLNPNEDEEADPLLKTINWNQSSLEYPILNSIGADFPHGGFGSQKIDDDTNGFKIVTQNSPLLEGTNLKKGDYLFLPSGEYDGAPIAMFDQDGFPVLEVAALNFKKIELIGFGIGSRFGKQTIGTFIAFRRNVKSGIVINTASYDWCSLNGMGGRRGETIKKITYNAITKLLKGDNIFAN